MKKSGDSKEMTKIKITISAAGSESSISNARHFISGEGQL